VLHLGRKRHLLERPDEVPWIVEKFGIALYLNIARIAAAKAEIVCEPDLLEIGKRVKAHKLGGNGVDCDLIG
jgi:hypothetical protein